MMIAVDHGNSSIKTEHFTFTSALERHANKPPMASDILEYDGSFWTMSGQRIPYMMDKTRDERFFVLTLIAIATELLHCGYLPPGADVDLAVGLPPEHFFAHERTLHSVSETQGSIVFLQRYANQHQHQECVCISSGLCHSSAAGRSSTS